MLVTIRTSKVDVHLSFQQKNTCSAGCSFLRHYLKENQVGIEKCWLYSQAVRTHTAMQVLYIMFQEMKADLSQFSFLCTLIEHRNGIKCLKLK